jgi:tRNA dimethylallyltransferase
MVSRSIEESASEMKSARYPIIPGCQHCKPIVKLSTVKVDSLPLTKLPIVCGGTHYYVQHLLFPPSDLSLDRTENSNTVGSSKVLNTKWEPPCDLGELDKHGMLPERLDDRERRTLETFFKPETSPISIGMPACEDVHGEEPHSASKQAGVVSEALSLYKVLQSVDSAEASRWHWRDTRKVRRGLERWWERCADELLRRKAPAPSTDIFKNDMDDGKARYASLSVASKFRMKLKWRFRYRTLIFWLYDLPDILNDRLDSRVDGMISVT